MQEDKAYFKVKKILELFPETRNSKQKLVIKYWNYYYGVGITYGQAMKILESESINSIIRESSFIQNTEGQFQPDVETKKKRGLQQRSYQTKFSPNKGASYNQRR